MKDINIIFIYNIISIFIIIIIYFLVINKYLISDIGHNNGLEKFSMKDSNIHYKNKFKYMPSNTRIMYENTGTYPWNRHIINSSIPYDVNVKKSRNIKSTDGRIINGPFNPNGDISVIQLNHYKCKTLEEFKYIRTRQRADVKGPINEDVLSSFNLYNLNEVLDDTASNFYAKIM